MSAYPVAVGQLWQDDVPPEQYPRTLRVEQIKTGAVSGISFARVIVVFAGGKNPSTGRWEYPGITRYIRLDELGLGYKLVRDVRIGAPIFPEASSPKEEPKQFVYAQSQVFPYFSKQEVSPPTGMFFEYLEAQRPEWRQFSTDRLSRMLQSWQAGYAAGLKSCEAGQKGQKP